MATLTEWEKQQLDSMHLLLEEAAGVIEYFKKTEEALSQKSPTPERNVDEEVLKFRLIVFDLYSVLDYTYYLLYCHFSNKGRADLSQKSTQCGFPFKVKGVKISDTSSHDMRGSFIKDKLKFLWGGKLGEDTHIWKEIGHIILSVQPKLKVDNSGAVENGPDPIVSLGDEESFALLHFYRNCCTHRGLVHFEAKDMIFQINQATRVINVVRERNDQEGIFNFHIPKTAYWIQLPEYILVHRSAEHCIPRMMMDVLQQLFSFVRRTSSKLLFSAFLIPRAEVILYNHLPEGHSVTNSDIKPINRSHSTAITIVSRGEELIESNSHKDRYEAIDGACTRHLDTLAGRRVYPKRPYKHMYITQHSCTPFPPIQILQKTSIKTNKMLLNELRQKIENLSLQFNWSNDGPHQIGNQPCFEVSSCVSILCDGKNLLKIQSSQHKETSKDKANEEAAKEVIEELAHLGFIQFKD